MRSNGAGSSNIRGLRRHDHTSAAAAADRPVHQRSKGGKSGADCRCASSLQPSCSPQSRHDRQPVTCEKATSGSRAPPPMAQALGRAAGWAWRDRGRSHQQAAPHARRVGAVGRGGGGSFALRHGWRGTTTAQWGQRQCPRWHGTPPRRVCRHCGQAGSPRRQHGCQGRSWDRAGNSQSALVMIAPTISPRGRSSIGAPERACDPVRTFPSSMS
eukprot:COSAG01_NODE_8066_length_2933_cov_3.447424_2_plen_214_part_00